MFDARIWKRSVFSGPAAMLVLALFQSLFVLSALLQSTWVYYRVYAAGPDQARYYHTVREPIALQLLGMLLVLMAAELLLWWCFGRLSVTATPVLVPLFVLLTLSTVYQTYARSPANAVKHFATILLGLGAMVASMVLVQLLARIRLSGPAFRWMLYGCWALCLLSLLAGLISRGGAFLDLGFLNIQPGEFFKLLTIFLIGAGFVHTLQDRRTSCLLLLTLLFLVLTLMLVGDLGNAFILFLAALLVIFFRYGARAAGALAAAAALGSAVGYRLLSAFLPADSRILWRVSNTFQALTVPLEGRVNRDLRTALFAALRGGVFGSGLAHNTYVLSNGYVYTDFVFDTVISFFGAAMALLVVLAVILLILRSRTDLEHTGQNLSHYIYSNLMVLVIATQAIVHVGGNLNVLPFTGVTFPFLSAGGSAMIASFMELGLALGGRVEGSCLPPWQPPPSGAPPLWPGCWSRCAPRWTAGCSTAWPGPRPACPGPISCSVVIAEKEAVSMFRHNKAKRGLRPWASALPRFFAGFLALVTVGGMIRLYAMAGQAFGSAQLAERAELSRDLVFLSDTENRVVDSTTPCYTQIVTRDGVVLWRSDRLDNPQTDAWFGLIGDVTSYRINQAAGKADRFFVSSYYDQLFRHPSYSLWTGLHMPDRTYTLTLWDALQNQVTDWMNQHQIQGSIFAYNASTGEIHCMASTSQRYINKNMYAFTPGSTMKLVTLLLAARQGIDLEHLSYTCTGAYTLQADGQVVGCTGIHGTIGTAQAIGFSCNCWFAQLIEQLDFAQAAQTLESLGVLVNGTGCTTLGQIRRSQSYVLFSDDLSSTFNNTMQLIGQDSGLMSPIDMAFYAALLATGGQACAPRLLTRDQPVQLDFALQQPDLFDRVYALWQQGYQATYEGYSDLITTAKTGTVSGLGPDNRRQRTLCLWSEPLQTAAFIVLENYDDCGVSLQQAANFLVEHIQQIESSSSGKESSLC